MLDDRGNMNEEGDNTRTHIVLGKGTEIGHYRIVQKIGAGGMGEVYLAEDTKLNRQVALKFLLPYLCQDADGRIRFKREAQAAAALSNAGIVTVYEVSEHEGRPYIAMEYLEGQSLRSLLSEKDLSLERVINLLSQVCNALAVAHQAGIVHRDIKPSNVHVTPGDCAKILDFGLAVSECFEQITRTGSTLGTVDYMSPEQARGDNVDMRSDLFSVGVMLYELITGHKPFRRNNQIATLQAIVNDDPEPLARYKVGVPAELQRIVSKLLSKKPSERYQHADDVAVDLRALHLESTTTTISEAPHHPQTTSQRRGSFLVLAPWLIAAVALVLLGWKLLKSPTDYPQRAMFLPVAEPPEYILSEASVNQVAVSRLGDRWVSRVVDSGSVGRALLWDIGSSNPKLLNGTVNSGCFFFSPDGDWLGFVSQGRLRKLHAAGGEPIDLCEAASFGARWMPDDTIYFCRDLRSGIWKIAANGGEPEQVTRVNADEFAHWSPEVLPSGVALLYSVWKTSLRDISTRIYDFKSGESRLLIEGGAHARWVPSGHLVYIRRGTLMAVPFDLGTLEITGSETPVIPNLFQQPETGLGNYDFSKNGFLVYLQGTIGQDNRRFVWVDQSGRITPLSHTRGAYGYIDLSPDENYLAYDRTNDGVDNIWIMELATGRSSQLTFESANFGAIWHPGGKKIAFSTYRHGPFSVYEIPVDRSEPEHPVIVRDVDITANDYTPDGKRLVVWIYGEDGSGDLSILTLDDTSRLYPVAAEPFNQVQAEVHPDGKWVTYMSKESGQYEVYVRPLDGSGGGVVQVSMNGGSSPLWSRDGSTLYYWRGNMLMRAVVHTVPQLRVGKPGGLFEMSGIVDCQVVSDGRFLMVQGDPTSRSQLVAVTNWFDELKRLTKSRE